MTPIKIGELRLIPKGTEFWSIKNQNIIMLTQDTIVEIKQVSMDIIFVIQKELIFNITGYIPTLISRGYDEWEISYSKTLPYNIPEPRW